MNNWVKNIGVWLVIGIVLMMLFMQVSKSGGARSDMDYSTLMQEAKNGEHVAGVYLVDNRYVWQLVRLEEQARER